MNNSNKGRLNQARRLFAKGQKSVNFEVPITSPGGGTSSYTRTFNFQEMPRLSPKNKGKVASKGQRTKREIEQENIVDIEAQEIKKLDLQRIQQLKPIEIDDEVIEPIKDIISSTPKKSIASQVI
jgi:hypothetical protein